MPEQFFDPDFSARIVRLLNLKGGSAPDLVNTEIQVVLDLSTLLARATDMGSGILAEAGLLTGNAGILYRGRFPMTVGLAVGQVMVAQVFNPVGSERRVIVWEVTSEFATPWLTFRRYDTAHGVVHPTSTLTRVGRPSRAPLAQVRRGVIATAGVPPAGAGDIMTVHPGGIHPNTLAQAGRGAVFLEPGEGLIWYPTNSVPGGVETPPTPLDNTQISQVVMLIEFPI